jgi:uncharacterized protein YfaS (alpha-2-macroglobulin family)
MNETSDKAAVTLPGKVEKVIKSPYPDEPEKAQVSVEGADDLYREIRIENTLHDENGKEVALKQGAEVDVVVQAHPEAIIEKLQSERRNKPRGPSN